MFLVVMTRYFIAASAVFIFRNPIPESRYPLTEQYIPSVPVLN